MCRYYIQNLCNNIWYDFQFASGDVLHGNSSLYSMILVSLPQLVFYVSMLSISFHQCSQRSTQENVTISHACSVFEPTMESSFRDVPSVGCRCCQAVLRNAHRTRFQPRGKFLSRWHQRPSLKTQRVMMQDSQKLSGYVPATERGCRMRAATVPSATSDIKRDSHDVASLRGCRYYNTEVASAAAVSVTVPRVSSERVLWQCCHRRTTVPVCLMTALLPSYCSSLWRHSDNGTVTAGQIQLPLSQFILHLVGVPWSNIVSSVLSTLQQALLII